MLPKERGDLPGVQRLPGQFRHGVVAAWQPHHVEVDTQAPDVRDHLARKIDGESQVVARGNETQRARPQVEQSWNERYGTDWFPELPQLFHRDMRLQRDAHMLGRDPAPRYVGNVSRDVIKDTHVD